MATKGDWFNRLRALNAQFVELTGREAYGSAEQPTPMTWRITFVDGTVKLSPREAHDYMVTLVWLARNNPSGLPYPLDQPVPPEWDLRKRKGG